MWKNVINPVFRRSSNVNPLVPSSFRALRLAQGSKRMGPGFRVPRRRPLRGCKPIRRVDFFCLFVSRAKFGEKSEYRSRIGFARFCRASESRESRSRSESSRWMRRAFKTKVFRIGVSPLSVSLLPFVSQFWQFRDLSHFEVLRNLVKINLCFQLDVFLDFEGFIFVR